MSQSAKALGVSSHSFKYNGQDYALHPIGPLVRAEYEAFLEKRAYNRLRRNKPHMSDEEYREATSQLGRDIDSGLYQFWSPLSFNTLKTVPECWQYFLMLRLRFGLPDNQKGNVTPEFIAAMPEADRDRLTDLINQIDAPPEAEPDPTKPGQSPAAS
jgi:hypothetical protein